ncbi:hypothetical protein [Heyndrickxia camelliae]|uniref:hypothetical protein n=1 Tax=Heyndrickxia camelliae TaxID=1707093 RepID=UPI0010557DD3|nr:hypothetical protein [Heyndrickxia camelliae]
MTAGKATGYEFGVLLISTKKNGNKSRGYECDDIKPKKFSIDKKSSFFYQITNQSELSVMLKAKNGEELTVRMDAYNGRCLEVIGPSN